MDYLYDGTFSGFLCCIYAHYYTSKCMGIYRINAYQSSLFNESRVIETDEKLAEKVYLGMESRLKQESLNHIHYVFQSHHPENTTYLLNYIEYGFKHPRSVDLYHTQEHVLRVHELSRKVSFEVHRFTGLLRFKDINGYLYADFEPDHNILEFLAPHFLDRLKNEKIIIHDKRRDLAMFGHQHEYHIRDFHIEEELEVSQGEIDFQRLWQGYIQWMSIKERENPKLQKQMMPYRYWKYLTEKKGSSINILERNG